MFCLGAGVGAAAVGVGMGRGFAHPAAKIISAAIAA
jgi:hypothetical protein